MKKYSLFVVIAVFAIITVLGCMALDPEGAPAPGLEIWITHADGSVEEVRVLDIDPEETAEVYLRDPATGASFLPGTFTITSPTIQVRGSTEFQVSGMAGGMGIVAFTSRAGNKSGNLHVFVRNWKNADVFRHTLEPDPVNYRFIMPTDVENERHTWWTDDANRSGPVNIVRRNVMNNSFAIYRLIVDRGFQYEAPDGLSNRRGELHNDTVRESYKELSDGTSLGRTMHIEPHILYYPLGEYPYEPDNPVTSKSWKEEFLRKPVFAFLMHYDRDGDMVGGYADRQRLELKTMDNSVPLTYSNGGKTYRYQGVPARDNNLFYYMDDIEEGEETRNPKDLMFSLGGGDMLTHRWKFKLPAEFKVSTEYTHIHQLKPEGADNGNPTFTLTGRKKSNGDEVLQLIYRGPIREVIGDREVPSANWYPSEVPLAPFLGEWVRAEETVTYDSPGAYRIKLVRIRDMRVLMEWEYNPANYDEEDPFVMFRKGNTYIRMKAGFYRRIMHMTPFGLPNPDDPVLEYYNEGEEVRILYTDFEMDKWRG